MGPVQFYTGHNMRVETCLVFTPPSSDGFCSIVTFSPGELGEILPGQQEVVTKVSHTICHPVILEITLLSSR